MATRPSRPAATVLSAIVAVAALVASALAVPASALGLSMTDSIAPGVVTGDLGLGVGTVSVPRGGTVTYRVNAGTGLAGAKLQIWTKVGAGSWKSTSTATVDATGEARYFGTVTDSTSFQARLPASATSSAAVAGGRAATVDAAGRSVIRMSCSETGALRTGTVAARSAGVKTGTVVTLSMCISGSTWRVSEYDPASIAVSSPTGTIASGTQTFTFTVKQNASRSVRLTSRGASLLVMLDATPIAVRELKNVPLTPLVPCGPSGSCVIRADVYAPASGGPWPTVVLLRGGPGGLGGRQGIADYAARLAAMGAVVFNADYRDNPASGAGFPRAFDDAACAVRVARATAATYGGDGSRITVLGHSLGGYVGAVIATSANAFKSACLATGNGAPDTFIGLAGAYLLTQPNLQADFTSVLGGTRSQEPYAWTMGDPFNWVGRRPGVVFRLIHGSGDPTVDPNSSILFDKALRGANLSSSVTTIDGASHVSLVGRTKDAEWGLAVVVAALH